MQLYIVRIYARGGEMRLRSALGAEGCGLDTVRVEGCG